MSIFHIEEKRGSKPGKAEFYVMCNTQRMSGPHKTRADAQASIAYLEGLQEKGAQEEPQFP